MKIEKVVEIKVKAKALYHDGKLSLSVSASQDYDGGKRSATGTISDGFSPEIEQAFVDAFELLLEGKRAQIAAIAEASHAEAVQVAARLGEL